jgi:trimeric autotransporter adhesin
MGILCDRSCSVDGRRWHALGGGINGYVYALALYKGNLYAGGDFTQAGEVAVNGLAVWDGASWSAVGDGVGAMQGTYKGIVRALAVTDDALYIGGDFTSLHDLATLDIARWDGRKLTALGDGLGDVDYGGVMDATGYGSIYALAAGPDGSLYAGGDFTSAGNREPLRVNSVARWDGRSWEALGSGLEKTYGKGEVRALAVDDAGTLYAGGQFVAAGGEPAASIAQWDGRRWQPVGSGLGTDSVYAYVNSLAVVGDALYAGGGMASIGGKKVAGLAIWQAGKWAGVGDGLRNGYDGALALHPDGAGGFYAGGAFTGAGGVFSRNLARWNGKRWSSLGKGIVPNSSVRALAWDGRNLFLGGSFSTVEEGAEKVTVNGLLLWDRARPTNAILSVGATKWA